MAKLIEFRVWDKKHGVMYYEEIDEDTGVFLYPKGYLGTLYTDKCGGYETDYPNHLIPLEYTGIKDKNKIPIYDGDLIKVLNLIYEIFWDETCLSWSAKVIDLDKVIKLKVYSHFKLSDFDNNIYEVVGNIFEKEDEK